MSYREDLKAFVDGELSPARAEEIRVALDRDPALQQEVAFMKLLGDAIREEAQGFEVKGAEETLEQVRKKRSRPQLLDWRLASGLVSVLLIALIASRRSGTEDASSAPDTSTAASSLSSGSVRQDSPAFSDAKAVAKNPAAAMDSKFLPGQGRAASSQSGGKESAGAMSVTTSEPAPAPTVNGSIPAKSNFNDLALSQSSRKVVQTGTVEIEVDDVAAAQSKAANIAKSTGGFVEDSNLNYSEDSQATSTLTMRVPAPAFSTVMQRLEAMGKVKSNSMTGEDVTAQSADVNARLTELRAEADDYVTMLRGARSIGQILEIKDRLSSVRQDIQSLQAQAAVLKDQSALSTISLTLDQKPKVGSRVPQKGDSNDTWAADSWASAVNGFKSVGRFIGQCLIFAFVYAPIWLPLMIVGWWMNKWQKRS